MNAKFTKGLPPDAKCFLSDSGWVNADLFLKWLQFFYEHVRPTPEHKALLILDNHEAHRSIKVIEYARDHNIVILSLPPHTSHRVQPLDVSVFSSFKGRFERVVAKWQKRFVGATMTLFDIGELFGEAYLFAATQSNAIEGFKKTGIAECDIDVFEDRDFRPAGATGDNDVPVDGQIDQELPTHQVEAVTEEEEIAATENELDTDIQNEVLADSLNVTIEKSQRSISTPLRSPEEIQPVPENVLVAVKSHKRRTKRSEVLTSTPIKNQIKANAEKRELAAKVKLEKEKKKLNEALKKVELAQKKIKSGKEEQKKRNAEKENEPQEEIPNKKKKKASKKEVGKEDKFECLEKEVRKKLKFPKKPEESSKKNEVPCLICDSSVSPSKETRLQCNICENRAHQACTAYSGVGFYVCDFCQQSN